MNSMRLLISRRSLSGIEKRLLSLICIVIIKSRLISHKQNEAITGLGISVMLCSATMLPRNLCPIRLSRRAEPFDSDQFIYELKIDGFRALAHLQDGRAELVSRNGNVFRGFAELATWLAEHLRVESAVLDGEIACLDERGRPNFRDLLFRRRQCIFIAFDLLWL